MENGGHFGRHIEFQRELQRDFWGLLVCCSTHIPGPILENSACYEIFPGLALFSSNALGLMCICAVASPGECLRVKADMMLFAGNTV